MCGRFVQNTPLSEIRVLFGTENAVPNTVARYNAAPTDSLAVVRYNPRTRQRSVDLLRWGLVPLWAKDISFGVRCINARAESIERIPAFRDASFETAASRPPQEDEDCWCRRKTPSC